MKRILLSFLLIIFLHLMNLSIQILYNMHKFDAFEVKGDIEYLSSNVFKGRLAGSDENKMITQYIKTRFEKLHLLPYNGSYLQSFKTKYPKRLYTTPYLKSVNKKGDLIIEYKYGVDYKEDMLNFRSNHVSFNESNAPKVGKDTLQIKKSSDAYVFYVPDENNLSFRSSFLSDSSISMGIMVTYDTFLSLKEQLKAGNTIKYYAPYEIDETELHNVVGVLKGKNPKLPPVILSAHFDHVGTDRGNNIYNGALDNASGVAFVLEMNKYLKSLGTPERDIIFIGFNAEEFGLLGSKAFVDKYGEKLQGSKVFNFDMIGSNNTVPLCIMGSKTDSYKTPFIQSVSSTCTDEKIYFNYIFEDASDHEYFRQLGIDAITFCDNDMSRIHTPQDKAEYISMKNINRAFSVASKEVIKYGYGNNPLFIYYNQMLILSTIGAMLVVLFAVDPHNANS
jgi:hypothetical protein